MHSHQQDRRCVSLRSDEGQQVDRDKWQEQAVTMGQLGSVPTMQMDAGGGRKAQHRDHAYLPLPTLQVFKSLLKGQSHFRNAVSLFPFLKWQLLSFCD